MKARFFGKPRRLFHPELSKTMLVQWVLALVISLVLWVISIGAREFTVIKNIPLLLPGLPPGDIILDRPVNDTVKVTFTGNGIGVLMDQMFRSPDMLNWHAPPSVPGEEYPLFRFHEFTADDVVFSGAGYSSLSPHSFNPRSISLTIDRKISRMVPVKVLSTGPVPARYMLSKLSADSVEITGAATVVVEVTSSNTPPVLPGTSASELTLGKPDGIVAISPPRVTAELLPPVSVVRPPRFGATLER